MRSMRLERIQSSCAGTQSYEMESPWSTTRQAPHVLGFKADRMRRARLVEVEPKTVNQDEMTLFVLAKRSG